MAQNIVCFSAKCVGTETPYNVKRPRRFWRRFQAAKAPHHDMSALEVESSLRFCEHLLYVQRSQRRTLSMLSQHFQKLQGFCQVLKGCKDGIPVSQVNLSSYCFATCLVGYAAPC